MFAAKDLVNLARTRHSALFESGGPIWEALDRIGDYLSDKLVPWLEGEVSEAAHLGSDVFIGKGTVVEPGATIKGPAWIGENCVVRAGAYVRENVIAGNGVMLGNSSEFKNCILFDNCEVPHFNYVGDSILGYKAHLGAGVILSNVRLDYKNVSVSQPGGGIVDSGLMKFGAIVGDETEIGCNSVLSPGSIIGRRCIIYPGTQWRGTLADEQIVKLIQNQQIVKRI